MIELNPFHLSSKPNSWCPKSTSD